MTTTRFRGFEGVGVVGGAVAAGAGVAGGFFCPGFLRSFLKNDMVMMLLWLLVVCGGGLAWLDPGKSGFQLP